MNQAGGLHGGNGGESTESCGCCFGDAAQGAGPGLVASVGPPMPETEQGWEPAREELLGTGIDMPRRGRPRSCVGEAFLPGLDGDRGLIHTASLFPPCQNVSIWGTGTCQPNWAWPGQLSGVAKQPREMEQGSLAICLMGCHAGSGQS